ncbi:hypothetical protein DL546_000730 [Coniochaeta pulveracea]|uniref:Rhodopsin domain-containing protein n=1 Tax=Coniochaeta pulveracea TaxID=177199 RepID=A0A420YHW0_9PEZI|nr:hypothetical protein DL546_000730 [Coniochaeta pulveracea]
MAGTYIYTKFAEDFAAASDLALREAADNATAATPVWLGDKAFDITTPMQQFGFAIVVFFPVLAFIACCLRVYSRASTKQFGGDDLLVCAAMVLSIGETAATYMFMKTNFIGVHFKDIPVGAYDPIPGQIWNFVVQVLYNPILALVKTSVLMFLLRLGGQKPGVRLTIHVVNAINIALMIAIFLVVMFQCWPIERNWNPAAGGHCIQQGVFYLATAGLTLFTDCLVLGLPIWIFADLKMAFKTKVALILVFIVGFIVTIVGAVRFWFIYQGFFAPVSANSDPTYTLGFCTSAIETNLAIITASAPALRPLFRQWFPRLFSSGHTGQGSGYPDTYGLSNNHRSRTTATANGSVTPGMMLKDIKNKADHKIVRSQSPTASEEEIMTFNGIMRTTNVRISYADEDAATQDSSNFDSRNQGPYGTRSHEKDYAMRTSMSSL